MHHASKFFRDGGLTNANDNTVKAIDQPPLNIRHSSKDTLNPFVHRDCAKKAREFVGCRKILGECTVYRPHFQILVGDFFSSKTETFSYLAHVSLERRSHIKTTDENGEHEIAPGSFAGVIRE